MRLYVPVVIEIKLAVDIQIGLGTKGIFEIVRPDTKVRLIRAD
jgi:hypothetical protein